MALNKEKTVTMHVREGSYRLTSTVTTVLMMLVCISITAKAQVDVEATALFYSSLNSTAGQYVNGFHSSLRGTFSPYQSHRSGAARDSAFVVRTAGGDAEIAWSSDPVPKKFSSDSVSFVWACGFGNNLGHEWFDLFINDTIRIPFKTVDDGYWTVNSSNGIRLSFTAVSQNANGANFGYMKVTMHRSFARRGEPINFSLKGRIIEREIWYRIFPYSDLLEYARRDETKPVYSSISFIHLGDAVYTCYAPKQFIKKKIQLITRNGVTAESTLQPQGSLARSTIIIRREEQPSDGSITQVMIGGTIADSIKWNRVNAERILAFMDEELVSGRYVFPPGEFPKFRWKNELRVENEVGKYSLKTTFYNRTFREVAVADSAGRYGAVIECSTAAGYIVKRYVTLYCSEAEFDDYSSNIPIRMNRLAQYGISKEQWGSYERDFESFSFGDMKMYPLNSPDAAVFLAGLRELPIHRTTAETPRVMDRQWWITMKAKLDGSASRIVDVKHRTDASRIHSSSLIDSSSSSAIAKRDAVEQLRTICRSWNEKGGVPHVTLVVHKGKIIFFEAFGNDAAGAPITKESKLWMASITKLLSGTLMMKFVDQGLVDLDAPVSRYLPELGSENGNRLTVRHLFTHLSGLHIAGEWASDWNMSLENQIGQLLPTVEVGKTFSYHRVGYALAGKIMERMTGRTVPALFSEHIFTPLGMSSAVAENTYGGLYCTAEDLAKFSQMLLQKGTYNGYRSFSEQTFESMLPEKLPVGDRRWGIGTSPMDENGLSDAAFGHGAASGSVLRIDPKNELIIISARNSVGRYHGEYERALIRACVALIKQE